MRPTIQEHLLGVGRVVDELAADPELSDDSAELAASAAKQLKRLAASVTARPSFLRWDNHTMSALLSELVPLLPDEAQHLVAQSNETAGPSPDDETRNEALRRLMTVVIQALPDGQSGDRARRAVADHLRARAAANPALHKNPQLPWQVAADDQATQNATEKEPS